MGALWVIVYELVPFDFARASEIQTRLLDRVIILPMSGHLAGSVGNLVADVTAKYLRYATLATCLVWLIAGPSRMSWRARARLVTAGTVARRGGASGHPPVSAQPALRRHQCADAAMAAAVTVVMLRGIRDFYRASPRVVDNLLTRRLIEGRSFDKNAISSLRRRRSGASPTGEAPGDPRD